MNNVSPTAIALWISATSLGYAFGGLHVAAICLGVSAGLSALLDFIRR